MEFVPEFHIRCYSLYTHTPWLVCTAVFLAVSTLGRSGECILLSNPDPASGCTYPPVRLRTVQSARGGVGRTLGGSRKELWGTLIMRWMRIFPPFSIGTVLNTELRRSIRTILIS